MTQESFNEAIVEFKELSEKTNKCREFILNEEEFNKLDMLNRDLLIAQLKAMETYLSILSIRLGVNGSTAAKSEESAEDKEESAE